MHRHLLAAALVWLTLCGGAVFAQAPAPSAAPKQGAPSKQSAAPILFTADELQNDQELGLTVARGHVQMTQDQRTLLADVVTYNQRTDTITASGHVSLQEPTGEILFADFMELHDHFSEAILRQMEALLTDRSRLAGNTARRTNGNRIELRRGVYSPCDLCQDNPEAPPVWQLRASDIVHDQTTHTIEYRNARVELGGIPIFYSPYLSHPDPTIKRRSGFLIPTVGNSSNLGFHATIPYYWAIGPDRDATFSPILTSGAGEVLAGEYRQRFSNGGMQLRGSVNYDPVSAPPGTLVRGHLLGTGQFDLNENWRSGFDIQRQTDQTYMRRFSFGGGGSFLTSRAYAEDFTQRGYLGINGYSFQTLRAGTNDSTQPIVLPVAAYNWVSQPDSNGAKWSLDGNVLDLNRLNGIGSHRASLGSGWSMPFSGPLGDLYTIRATTRGDSYYATDQRIDPNLPASNNFAGRVFPQVSVDWRYPWVRRGTNFSQVIEPVAMLVAAPNGGNPIRIPNEDSQSFDFDETDLFVPDRFPGLDRVDGGARVDYGIRAAIYGQHGGSSRVLIGQSYRLQKYNNVFPVGSGLETQQSDIVGRAIVSPSPALDLVYRFRARQSDLSLQRQEVGFSTGPEKLRLSMNYLTLPPDIIGGDPGRRDQITAAVTTDISRYWSASLVSTQNLTGSFGNVASQLSVAYRDECFAFAVTLTDSGTRDRDVKPGLALLVTLVFKNLGEINAPAFSTTGF
ncbi:MAG: lptD [Rhodospirillales bacterium]|nr:lptD [Rhodospirillales bacterium]